jgi:hypothetical protein
MLGGLGEQHPAATRDHFDQLDLRPTLAQRLQPRPGVQTPLSKRLLRMRAAWRPGAQ